MAFEGGGGGPVGRVFHFSEERTVGVFGGFFILCRRVLSSRGFSSYKAVGDDY